MVVFSSRKIMKRIFVLILSMVCVSCLHEDTEVVEPAQHADERTWLHLDSGDGLSPGFVLDLFYDAPNYWVATSNGVSFYDGDDFQQFTENDVLVDSYVTSIAKDRNGSIWFGTYGGASLYDGQEDEWYEVPQIGGFDWQITSMEQLEDGDLLIGTQTLGLILYDGAGFLQVFDDTCNDCNQITDILQDSKGDIWVGSVADLKRYDSKFELQRRYRSGLAGHNVSAIHEDQRGQVWLGFNDANAVTRISDGKTLDITLVAAYPEIPVFGFATGPGDELWIGSFINGVLRYDGGVIRPVFGGPDEERIITSVVQMNKQIFIGTDDGLYIYTTP